jgi:SAM-dependent methyltransferase
MPATDWNLYYRSSPSTSRFTRSIIRRVLIGALKRFSVPNPTIVELGGAGSCVFDAVVKAMEPREYHIVDSNQYGLDLMRTAVQRPEVRFHCGDALVFRLPVQADIVFSLGLIEHFDENGTREAITAHLRLLKVGGIAIISFPTPTRLYRATRRMAELLGKWIFHDERPLELSEVIEDLGAGTDILYHRLIWPIFLTQTIVVARKRDDGPSTVSSGRLHGLTATDPIDR